MIRGTSSSKIGLKPSDIVAGFELIDLLGSGGNAEVWRVKNSSQYFALKILKSTGGEPLQRFIDEIKIMTRLKNNQGVFRIVDSHLPNPDVKKDRAWIAMPIGQPIKINLEEEFTVERTISAILEISRTLEKLHAELISHRDIKPDNLFYFEGKYVIGDFGLVNYPAKDSVTAPGKQLGPRNFIAPEMLNESTKTDGTKADVFSLAKTLWSLLAGNDVPSGGVHVSGEDSPISLNGYVKHDRLELIDNLLVKATHLSPDKRIPMKVFADELEYWLDPKKAMEKMDINERISKQYKKLIEPENLAKEAKEKFEEEANKLNLKMRDKCQPVYDHGIRTTGDKQLIFNNAGQISEAYASVDNSKGQIKKSVGSKLMARVGSVSNLKGKKREYYFFYGYLFNYFENGEMNLFLFSSTAFEEVPPSSISQFKIKFGWNEAHEFHLGLPSAEKTMENGVQALLRNFDRSMDSYLVEIDQFRQGS